MKVYIAGPMRGHKHYNFAAFERAENVLSARGYDVVNPMTLDIARGFDPRQLSEAFDYTSAPEWFDLRACIRDDVNNILDCQILALLPGWENSKGAKAEKAIAEWLGIETFEIIYDDERISEKILDIEFPKLPPRSQGTVDPFPANPNQLINKKPTNPKDAIGSDKLPIHLFPSTAIAYGCIAMLNGALKYGRSNFRAVGVRASIYYDACFRHMMAWFEGEELDPDDGVPHLGAALACIAILIDSQIKGNMNDDRMFPTKYREELDRVTKMVKVLKEQHKSRKPKHWSVNDNVPALS